MEIQVKHKKFKQPVRALSNRVHKFRFSCTACPAVEIIEAVSFSAAYVIMDQLGWVESNGWKCHRHTGES